MRPLTNVVRSYAWGSHTAIASLQRRAVPSAQPEAEFWLGAHPSAPSLLSDGGAGGAGGAAGAAVALADVIARDPLATLGTTVAGRFGPRLPYLLKILAADEPLSLQAHPNAEQARAGFAAEQARADAAEPGPGTDVPGRNYVDPHHKPELLVAVERFHALCGFREPADTAGLLSSFGVPALAPVIDALRTGSTVARLRGAVRLLLDWPDGGRATLVAAVTAAGRSLAGSAAGRSLAGSAAGRSLAGTAGAAAAQEDQTVRAHALAATLGERYPGDVGVVVALLLNNVRLAPDEAIFLPAGNLHTYVRGVGVEVMAASDNVLRGGLTRKRVDPAELERILRYEVLPDPVVRPVPVADGVLAWPVSVAEFALVKAVSQGEPVLLPGGGPRILVCLRGEARLSTDGEARVVGSGEAVFVTAAEAPVTLRGEDAVVFQASPGSQLDL